MTDKLEPCPRPGEIRVIDGQRLRFIERELEGDKWEVLGPAAPPATDKQSGVVVPRELVMFLLGEGEFEGRDFGDPGPVVGRFRHPYWWRHALRQSLAAAPPANPAAGVDAESDVSIVARWLDDVAGLDLDDVVADGGVTSGMVVQQEARSMAARLRRHFLSAQPVAEDGWRATHRHVGRGTEYQVIHEGVELQAATGPVEEGGLLTIYVGTDGKLWARRAKEFGDGRFERLPAPPIPAAQAEGG